MIVAVAVADVERHHWFVAPPLDGPITGGTLFNRFLVEALESLGDQVSVVGSVDACEGFAWIDSLYLPRMEGRWTQQPAGLFVHYLPSVFEGRSELTPFEVDALAGASTLMCTGAWMREAIIGLGADAERTAVVTPGVHAVEPVASLPESPVVAVVVGTVTERKGILPLLEALRVRMPVGSWRLEVLGDLRADADYASACQRTADGMPVVFRGAIPPPRAREAIAASHMLLSAASVESYGMAIAEAQAFGVPVVARRGGHVAQLVETVPSGLLADDAAGVARAFCELVEDPAGLAARRHLSQGLRPRRTWLDAAREFRLLRACAS